MIKNLQQPVIKKVLSTKIIGYFTNKFGEITTYYHQTVLLSDGNIRAARSSHKIDTDGNYNMMSMELWD